MSVNLEFLGGLRFIINGIFEKSDNPEGMRSDFIGFLSEDREATGVLLDRVAVFENKDQFFAKCWDMHCAFQTHGIYSDLEGTDHNDLNRWIHFLVAFGYNLDSDEIDDVDLDAVFDEFLLFKEYVNTAL